MKDEKTFQSFAIPAPPKLATTGDTLLFKVASQYLDLERRLFIMEGRIKELEALYYEAMEEDCDPEDLSLGSQDSLSDSGEEYGTPKLSRKKAKTGKVLKEILQEKK